MSTKTRNDTDRLRAFNEEVLRAAYVSLFWAVVTERRKHGTFTLQSIAEKLNIDKSGVSRWFSGDPPNWELNTIAAVADALGIELQEPTAIDRATGVIFTPSGVQQGSADSDTTSTDSVPPPRRVTKTPQVRMSGSSRPPQTSTA